MDRTPRAGRRTAAGFFVLSATAIAACSSGGGDETLPTVPSTVEISTTSEPSDPVDTEVTTEPTPGTTAAPESTTPDTTQTTAAATTSTSTIPPTTSTTEPLAVQELLIRPDGIGSAVFGAEPEGVIQYVTSILGSNTADTGWVDPFAFAACDGSEARRVDWGVLTLLFGDLSDVANGRRHLLGVEYGLVGSLGDEPVGLHTPGGTGLGTRVVDLRAEFDDVGVNEGEDDLNIPPNFYVNNNFRGLLTGTEDDDVVTVIFAGYGCGE